MAWTPMCPQCGSVRTERIVRRSKERARLRCLEPDCGHEGFRPAFMAGGPGSYRKPNERWRDPVALLPGGYADNS